MLANRTQVLEWMFTLEAGPPPYKPRISPSEPGGVSFCGVSLTAYTDDCHSLGLPTPTKDELCSLTREQINGFYSRRVLDAILFNQLPTGVDYLVADGCANRGDAGYLDDLRDLFDLTHPLQYWRMDGLLLQTLCDPRRPVPLLIDAICDARWAKMQVNLDFVTRSATNAKKILGDGRAFRMNSVRRWAREMIGFPPEPDGPAARYQTASYRLLSTPQPSSISQATGAIT
jgi:lysozyme family protein